MLRKIHLLTITLISLSITIGKGQIIDDAFDLNKKNQIHTLIFFEDKKYEGRVIYLDDNIVKFKTNSRKVLIFERNDIVKISVTTRSEKVNLEFAKIKYGLKTGLNYSNISEIYKDLNPTSTRYNFEEFSPILEYQFGMFAKIKIKKRFSILIELALSKKGTDVTNILNKTKQRDVFNYLSVPLLVEYSPLKRISLQSGISLNHLISIKSTGLNSIKNFKRQEIGGLLGIDFKLSKLLNLNLRYNRGITPIEEPFEVFYLNQLSFSYRQKHHSLQFSIFCSFIGYKKNKN